jgi:hypothetical protein
MTTEPPACDYTTPELILYTLDEVTEYYRQRVGVACQELPLVVTTPGTLVQVGVFLRDFSRRYPDVYPHIWGVYPMSGFLCLSTHLETDGLPVCLQAFLIQYDNMLSPMMRSQFRNFVVTARRLHDAWHAEGMPIDDGGDTNPA